MYLVDTNVWLEVLLEQERMQEAGHFLESVESNCVFITDFSFHSIALILTKLKQSNALLDFIRDAFVEGGVFLLHLKPEDISSAINVMRQFNLDFDDAYQYVAAEQYKLTIVSFDTDFDKTPMGRKTPGKVQL